MNSDFGGWNYLIIFLWRLRRKKIWGSFLVFGVFLGILSGLFFDFLGVSGPFSKFSWDFRDFLGFSGAIFFLSTGHFFCVYPFFLCIGSCSFCHVEFWPVS